MTSVQGEPPRNPLLGHTERDTTPPSTIRSSKANREMHQSILKHQVRLYDHRCLVTGAVSTQLWACRLVDTICTESNREKEFLVRILVIPETLGGG